MLIGRLQIATNRSVGRSRRILAGPVAAGRAVPPGRAAVPRRHALPRNAALAWRALAAAALLSVAIGAALNQGLVAKRSAVHPGASRLVGLSSLPLAAQGPISAAMGADSPAYRVSASAAGLEASNPAQHLRAGFGRSGTSIRSGALEAQLGLRAVGYGGSLAPVGEPSPRAAGNRVVYAHGAVSEWYANGPLGLEQGFTLTRAPSVNAAGPLTLSIALSGNARAALSSGGQSLTLSRSGAPSLRYGGLAATDAKGRALRSWLELDAGRVLLRVDARGARYPLRIDPLVEQAKLEGDLGKVRFGRSVALSANGNTALIGGPRVFGEVGAAWVFTRSGSTWTEQARLEGSKEATDFHFGRSVALSGDGNTALIGDPGSEEGTGSAWVFTRSGSSWTQRAELTGGGEIGAGQFGARVALSGAGTTALISGSADNSSAGAAWVFTGAGSSWTQAAKLEGGGETGSGKFGRSLALSSDGGTAAIGGLAEDGSVGAVWVFTAPGWTQQTKLEQGGESRSGEFGGSLALSADGSTALIGVVQDSSRAGEAWVFTRSGEEWTPQGPPLNGGPEESGEGAFGASVALSSEGDIALIGGPEDGAGQGAAWLFTRSGSTWSQQGKKLTGGGEVGAAEFGWSVALSAEGSTALIGGLADAESAGAAWVFASPLPSVTKVEPGEGPATGGTPVTISGSEFTKAATVSFGSTEAEDVQVESPTQISAIAPPGTGRADVTVATAGGVSPTGAADRFKYVPSVTKVEPGEGPAAGDKAVTITGTGFSSTSTVSFGSNESEAVQVESPTEIRAVAPAGSGTVDVVVTTAGGESAKGPADHFTYEPPVAEPEPEPEPEPTPKSPTQLLTGGGAPPGGGSAGTGILPFVSVVAPPPTLGVSGNVAPVSGNVYVRVPGTPGFVLLSSLRQVPFGTVIDARHGTVSVTTIGPNGHVQTGQFYAGEFVLSQGANGKVVATLVGGNFNICPTATERSHLASISSRRASGKHVVRKLWANAHGSFSTKGNYAAGAVQGTKWVTEDLCDGTRIRVTRDKVKVTNLVTHKTIEVFNRHSYLAKAP